MVVTLVVVDVYWCARAGMVIQVGSLAVAAEIGLMALSVVYRRRSRSLADITGTAALWAASASSCVVLSYLCASCLQPLQDALFADLDRKLGFDWWAWHSIVLQHPALRVILAISYFSLAPQILLVILYLPATGRRQRTAEFLLLATTTAIVCCVLSALWPAMGPSTEFSYIPDLLTLRTSGPWRFHLLAMEGIVTMPSYHTTLAFLLIYAFRNTGVIGSGVTALNVVMLPAIPAIGGHYLVDMLAGAAVAVLAIGTVRLARHAPLFGDVYLSRKRSG